MNRLFTHHSTPWNILRFLAVAAVALWLPGAARAQSYAFKTLHAFNGIDSEFPFGLTMDPQGNLYGVALKGGVPDRTNNGIVYKLTPAGIFTTLASFDGLDGDMPNSPIVDDAGNLWGTTTQGGVDWHPENNHYGFGTIYKISSTGVFTPGLVEFTGPHGIFPGSLLIDPFGNLFGAASQGGALWNTVLGDFGLGAVFQMSPNGVISNPLTLDGGNGAFAGGLVRDSLGNLYGTTTDGGTYGDGTLYKVAPDGVVTILVNFNGVNGMNPGAVTIDSQGNLYGTTYTGGVTAINGAINGYGTLWKYSPAGRLTSLVSFNGDNGMFPKAGVTLDGQGNLFGTTGEGGPSGQGVVFEYSNTGVLSVLAHFDGPNGSSPDSPVSVDSLGNIYGVVNLQGPGGFGSIFVVQPISTTLTVASITLTPGSIPGGAKAQGTLTISAPAPAGGLVVTLGSNSSYATPLGPVTVPAGATGVSFTVNTQPVPDITPVAISARLGSSTQQITLTIAPPATPAVAMVYLDDQGVQGGGSMTGTVLLNRVAPVGGTLVTLSSASPNARVPASVTVPAGAQTVTFPVVTLPVAANDDVMLTVSVGASFMQAGVLILTPAANASIVGNVSINFPVVQGGTHLLGRVSLSLPARAGGAPVMLSSNNPAVIVPATMTVPEGVGVASFPITTTAMASSTVATITASRGGTSLQTTVTILPTTPITLSSLQLNTPGEQGEISVQGMVLLNTVAPVGGAIITLSSNSSLVAMPATVAAPEAEASAFFAITTKPVTVTTTVTITATIGASSQQVPLILTPGTPGINISSVALTPSSIQGGVVGNGVVTLTSPAPIGGTVVSLTDSNTAAATVPATVVIPAGQVNMNFPITTRVVNATATTTLSATLGSSTKSAVLTVTPAPSMSLASVSINPVSVTSGKTAVGTVTLTAAAPTGGFPVTLMSSDTSVGEVPAGITVPAGAASATFIVTTIPVASTSMATITATAGVISKQATITAVSAPVSLSLVSLNPTSVKGGATVQGMVTLSNPAPAGGALINLSSSNTGAATVPISVTIPAGAVFTTFTVSTNTVTASTSVTVKGTYLGASQTASLAVTSASAPADTVSVAKAEYTTSNKSLHVEATSSSKTAAVNVYVTSTGAPIGSLANDGSGRFKGDLSCASNPQDITLKSSAGGSAGKTVTAK